MMSQLKQYAEDHRYLLDQTARALGMEHPIALDLNEFHFPLVRCARRRQIVPIDGVLVRDWGPEGRRTNPGIQLGIRAYEIQGVTFARVRFTHDDRANCWGLDFFVVDQKDYLKLYKIALRCRRDEEPPGQAPVMLPEQLDLLYRNTIGYLEGPNLDRIKTYGGRAKRGILLTGSPGNGKTMACRWLWEMCRQRRWEYRVVTPDNYRQARAHDSIEALFSFEKRGIVFFDDMDLALRDREKVGETEDQAVFLGALDGLQVNEGVVFVFTTNCSLDLIDKAFKRPGRLDLVMHFKAPDLTLRRQLMERWHKDIRAGIDLEHAAATSEGYSFAEIEELKNLLVMRFMEAEAWDWDWAMRQFTINRAELTAQQRRQINFGSYAGKPNGRDEPVA